LGTPIDVSTALAIEEQMQPILQRRLLFSLLFVFGTLAAVFGWLAGVQGMHIATYIAIAGHAGQVIGLLGSMLTPDRVERDRAEADDREESDTDFLTKGF
jgi:hypothetical protein